MLYALLLVALLGAFVHGEPWECHKIPKVRHDASKFQTLAPYGDKWMITVSNQPGTDQCVNFQYLGNRNNINNLATGLFINKPMNVHMTFEVRIDKDMDQWRAKDVTIGQPSQPPNVPDMAYRKLFIDYMSEVFCIYTCDDKGKYFDLFRCMTTNTQGVQKLNEILMEYKQNNSLPFKNGMWPVNVWNASMCNTNTSQIPSMPLKLGPLNDSLPNGGAKIAGHDDENIGVNGKKDGDDDDDDDDDNMGWWDYVKNLFAGK